MMTGHWLTRTTRFLVLNAMLATLVACGGGGGDSDSGGFLGGAEDPIVILSIQSFDPSGSTTPQFSIDQPLRVVVSLRSDGDATISGQRVELSTTIGTITPSNGSALTNAEGDAEFTIAAGDISGAGVLTASYAAASGSITATQDIEVIAEESVFVLDLQTVNAAGASVRQFSTTNPLSIRAILYTIRAGILSPVSDVALTAVSSIGTISPDNGSTLSDGEGLAEFQLTGGETTGAGRVTVTYQNADGVTLATRSVNVEAVSAGSGYTMELETSDVDGNTTRAFSSEEPLLVRATVTPEVAGASREGLLVTLVSTVGSVTPEGGAALTNAQGVATFLLSADGVVGAGVATATLSLEGASVTAATTVEAQSIQADRRLVVRGLDAGGQPTFTFSEGMPLTVRVAIEDQAGNIQDIDGATINLTSSIGSISPSNGSALTTDGIASFVISYDRVVGAGVVTADYVTDDGVLRSSLNVETTAAESFVLNLVATGGNENGQLGPNDPIDISVSLTEAGLDGVPVTGALLQLDTGIATVTPANGARTTNDNGEAVFTLNYADVEGAGPVTVSYTSPAGDLFSNTINIEAARSAAPPIIQIEFTETSDGISTTSYSARAPLSIGVLVTEADGVTPRVGESVLLSNTIGRLSPANGIAITDDSGIARFTLSYDGETGAGVIATSLPDFDASGVSQLSVQSIAVDTAYELTLISASNNGVITRDTPVTLNFQLAAIDANLSVANQVISLSSTLGTVSPGNGSTRTDADGIASFTLSYDDVLGAGTATATYTTEDGAITAFASVEAVSPAVSNSLQITTFNGSGSPSRQVSADSAMTVNVTLVDASGATVDLTGELIQLSSTIGQVTPANGTALLLDGVATFNVAYDGEVGAGELTATYDVGAAVLRATRGIESVVANPYTVSLESSGGALSVNNPLTVTVQVLDSTGQAVTPAPVIEVTSTIGVLDRSSGVADVSGNAVFNVSYDGAGAGVLTATVSSDEGTFTNTLNIDAVIEAPDYSLNIVSVQDPTGADTSDFSSSEPITVVVQLQEAGAIPAGVRPITLTITGVPGEILPANAVSLTDPTTGQATFQVNYGGQTGAGELIASYAGPLGDVTDSRLVEAVVADLDIGSLDDTGTYIDAAIRALPSTDVSYLGSVELLLAVVDADLSPVTSVETVRFESTCLTNGFSTLNTGLITDVTNGAVSVTYTAGENCEDRNEIVTATLVQPGRTLVESATVTLALGAAPAANERFITFVSAEPINMALRGTGGGNTLEERSQVTFEVRDGAGNPVSGQRVDFALSATTGGIELADASGTTDASGQVKATVFAGVIATPVRVIASTERRPAADPDTDPTNDIDAVSVVSDQLSISSGIVTQGRFSIAASVLNVPAAAVVNGVTTEITASAFDRFGNPVPDGTTVNFTSECGGIGGSGPTGACQTVAGFCTVTWFSQPGSLTVCPDNRVTIMAHAQGEEAFTDADANGFYSTELDGPALANEAFVDNQEAWRDDNESGDYTAPELFIDVDTGAGDTPPLNGQHDDRTPPTPAVAPLFNGLACLDDTETYCKKALVSVFDTLELIAGTDDAAALTAGLYTTGDVLLDPATISISEGTYIFRLSDDTGATVNFPPFGTTVSTTTGGECEVVSPALTVGNSSAETFFQFPVTIRTENDDQTTDDFVEITWAIPGGNGNRAQLVFDCSPPP